MTASHEPAGKRFGIVVLCLGLLMVAVLALGERVRPGGRSMIKVQGVDEVAYFGTAHSLFFDHDLDLTNQYDRLRTDRSLGKEWFTVVPETGLPQSAFAIGVSLLEIPFMAVGHLVDLAAGGPGDGYGRACIGACFVAGIVFICLGLLFTERLLRLVAQEAGVAPAQAAVWSGLVTLLLWPGTTLLYYSYTLLSQASSFMATALFLLTYWRARRSASLGAWVATGAAAGLMTLCRWQDLLFVAVAAVDEVSRRVERFEPEEGWLRWGTCRLISSAAAVIAFLPQLVAWKTLFGHYVTIPQGRDFFVFPPPHLARVLFSSLNGWFTWTPLAFLGVLGLLAALRRRPGVALSLLVPITLQWMLLSSLRDVWHGALFGARNLTSCAPILGVGLLWLLLDQGFLFRAVTFTLAVLCAAYSFLFAVQYRLDLVPRHEYLNAQEMIWDKLRLDRAWHRRGAANAISGELEKEPQAAARAAEEAIAAFGADRRLLELLAEARGRSGDATGQDEAQERLRRLLDSRLF